MILIKNGRVVDPVAQIDEAMDVLIGDSMIARVEKDIPLSEMAADTEVIDATGLVVAPGLVDDVLSYMDHCSIYINPLRRGGGGSAVEAMYKGVVPVTFAFGDVYVNTADDFAVDGYDQMRTRIDELLKDESYYAEMSAKVRRRAAVCMDSSTAFMRVMGEYERRMIDAENNGRL